jgi:hypothetical protein
MDYAGPADFPPTSHKRGVGQHPHRGFETVTIVYDGGVSHRDSSGGGGTIGPGDVQWMTAASGLIHEEYHSPEFAARGGTFEVVQLWVNLPAKDKLAAPGYQGIVAHQIPEVALADGMGTVRVIAGRYGEVSGPAKTFTPVDVWDIRVKAGQHVSFDLPARYTTALFVRRGAIRIGEDPAVKAAELAVMTREGSRLSFQTVEDTSLLLLNGEPLDEPIVGYGPFVMNSRMEIAQAIDDFKHGRFGRIEHRS